jgi:hypothetical protein
MTDAAHPEAGTVALHEAYRDIFTTMNSRGVLWDTPMKSMLVKLMDTSEEFVKELASFITDLPGDDHHAALGFVGGMLRKEHVSAHEFVEFSQPFIDHYRRMFADLPEHFTSLSWGRMSSYIVSAIGDYPEAVKSTLTPQRIRLLMDASVSIIHSGMEQPAAKYMMSRHIVPDASLIELILEYPDKSATINRMLRAGDHNMIEISALVTGQTILPLLDGVL